MYSARVAIAFAVTALLAGHAHAAQCEVNGAPKAKALKWSFVRSFAGCPSAGFPATNSVTGTGVPTCALPYEQSQFKFDAQRGT